MKKNSKTNSGKTYFPIVVIGASAGGFTSILEFTNHLPSQFNGAVFIVMHLSKRANIAFLIQYLQQHTHLNCKMIADKDDIQPGTIYFAAPQRHLIIANGKTRSGTGPEENHFKPSIDILFRTAAVEYRERVAGIILSGLLDDGVGGMLAIKRCGGFCMVQEPLEAEYADMPLAVIEKMKPDRTLPVVEMGKAILQWWKKPKKKISKIPEELVEEVEIIQKVLTGIDETRKLGTQSLFTCPACGGVLWSVNDPHLKRYRCFTGHAFTEKNLLEEQKESLKTTLWVALRLLEERKKLLGRISSNDNKLNDIHVHIERMKKLLSDLQMLS